MKRGRLKITAALAVGLTSILAVCGWHGVAPVDADLATQRAPSATMQALSSRSMDRAHPVELAALESDPPLLHFAVVTPGPRGSAVVLSWNGNSCEPPSGAYVREQTSRITIGLYFRPMDQGQNYSCTGKGGVVRVPLRHPVGHRAVFEITNPGRETTHKHSLVRGRPRCVGGR